MASKFQTNSLTTPQQNPLQLLASLRVVCNEPKLSKQQWINEDSSNFENDEYNDEFSFYQLIES